MKLRTVDIEDATDLLKEYAAHPQVAEGPVVVVAGGRPVAAVIPVDDFDLELMSPSANPRFLDIIERSRARQSKEGGISSDEMRRRLGLSRTGEHG